MRSVKAVHHLLSEGGKPGECSLLLSDFGAEQAEIARRVGLEVHIRQLSQDGAATLLEWDAEKKGVPAPANVVRVTLEDKEGGIRASQLSYNVAGSGGPIPACEIMLAAFSPSAAAPAPDSANQTEAVLKGEEMAAALPTLDTTTRLKLARGVIDKTCDATGAGYLLVMFVPGSDMVLRSFKGLDSSAECIAMAAEVAGMMQAHAATFAKIPPGAVTQDPTDLPFLNPPTNEPTNPAGPDTL